MERKIQKSTSSLSVLFRAVATSDRRTFAIIPSSPAANRTPP
ncbi:hypothetical protein A2U01_0055459 [Trifolium medium]|uniref:Uncharacterized protein n=1 Tax=Trifolium medium TaxID=97028 RepID=A0A392RCD3_9FABA|nr:hypothetical protein [Trifolium medium]